MGAPTVYPSRALDDPRQAMLDLLGTFWQRAYANRDELEASFLALASAWRQADRDLDEAVAALAFETIPVLHVREWWPLKIRSSARNDVNLTGNMFGDPGLDFGGAGFYGDRRPQSSFPIVLGEVVDAPLICNAPIRPTVCDIRDVDYTLDARRGIAWLRYDPFADGRWVPTPIYDDLGHEVDRELTVWVWHAGIDRRLLFRRLGYALGLALPSTENGRELGNLLVDAITQGTSELALRRFFSSLTNIPVCRSDGEVVAAIFEDQRGLVIATDREAYRFDAAATPVVSVGDRLLAGDPMTAGLRFDVLNAGDPPGDLSALAVGPGILPVDLPGELIFVNAEVPIQVSIPPR
jgi:hypothetical protein